MNPTGDSQRTYAERGFSLVELLLVIALIGIIAAAAVPQYLRAYNRSHQRGTMAEMRSIAEANGSYRLDEDAFASELADLEGTYLVNVPTADAWENEFGYTRDAGSYTLTSYGSDGAPGPDAPADWTDEPFEADLILENGHFTQSPRSVE